jgi:chromosome segregation ATPase
MNSAEAGSTIELLRRIRTLESELAISKGREEGKQLVINQLEAERDHLQRGFNAACKTVAAHEDRIKDLEAERDELALDTTKSDAEAYDKRICEFEAALKEAELQRDSWKRIAESGLGIPQTETL